MNRVATLLLILSISLISTCAHADIFGYIDEQGVGHFSPEKIDDRYQLFLRGDRSFDSSQLISARRPTVTTPLFRYLTQHPNQKKYDAMVTQAATDFSLDPALLKAIMAAESGFNPTAVSPKGAIGLMQIMPDTAARYGLQADKKKTVAQKLTDPKTNIRLSARYLRDLTKMFPKQLDLVIASYNAGEAAVEKYKNTIPPFPETRNYVVLVTQFFQFYQTETSRAGVAVKDDPADAPKRFHMTIPGRGNMPAPPTTTIE